MNMTKIPEKLRASLAIDDYYKKCVRQGFDCDGRITWEHVWIYGGSQIQEKWAIIPLCWQHHLGSGLNKDMNKWISLRRATFQDLTKYPKKDWAAEARFVQREFGRLSPIIN